VVHAAAAHALAIEKQLCHGVTLADDRLSFVVGIALLIGTQL
jgi:hypothetical protein